jgi:serine/threonine protein kinase
MGAKLNSDTGTYEEQLSELESRLKVHDQDKSMLGDVGLAIRNLLTRNGGSEGHIRQILERQFDQGNLRRETYELVEKLLGKIVAEGGPHSPDPDGVEEPYVDTAVIEQPGETKPSERVNEQLQIGSVLRDRYLLKEQVAEGSMGTVYKALDRRLAETGDKNPFVAIKVLSPKLSRNGTALRALQQEAAKGRCLSHPNIVRFIDLDREDELFFIVMEWLPGRSLARILDDNRGSALEFSTAMNIVRQTARALTYAHQRGVIHADVKPGNIIITPQGKVKLIDFGVARVRQKENEGKSRFDPNVMRAGSPAYSSMQVLTGEDPVPADDVFSLACLMYRLIAGYRVFGPRNAADAAQEGMEPQAAPGLNAGQWQVLRKALSYPRVTRFDSPKAFMDAFAAAPGKGAGEQAAAGKSPSVPAAITAVDPSAEPEMITKRDAVEATDAGMHTSSGAFEVGADETTQVAVDVPMRAGRDSIMFEQEQEPPSGSRGWLIVAAAIVIAATAVIFRPQLINDLGLDESFEMLTNFVDDLAERTANSPPPAPGAAEDVPEDAIEALEAFPDETDIADMAAAEDSENVVEELVIDSTTGTVDAVVLPIDESAEPVGNDAAAASGASVDAGAEPAPDALPPPVDFSMLPAPAAILDLAGNEQTATVSAAIREGSEEIYIDVVRDGDLSVIRELMFVETTNDGRRRGASSTRYALDNGGMLVFERGQPRARLTVSIPSNELREPDLGVTLGLYDSNDSERAIGRVQLTVEDDDQRAFEAGLPVNTVGFTAARVQVREFEPAVQVDLVVDVSATEGQDYFAPGLPVVYFGPGQRTARILVPLGQDARREQDERFMIELDTVAAPANSGIYAQISVTISDDDL